MLYLCLSEITFYPFYIFISLFFFFGPSLIDHSYTTIKEVEWHIPYILFSYCLEKKKNSCRTPLFYPFHFDKRVEIITVFPLHVVRMQHMLKVVITLLICWLELGTNLEISLLYNNRFCLFGKLLVVATNASANVQCLMNILNEKFIWI